MADLIKHLFFFILASQQCPNTSKCVKISGFRMLISMMFRLLYESIRCYTLSVIWILIFLIFKTYDLTEKSDVYSLGVLLWELTSCSSPFNLKILKIFIALDILGGRRENLVPGKFLSFVKVSVKLKYDFYLPVLF